MEAADWELEDMEAIDVVPVLEDWNDTEADGVLGEERGTIIGDPVEGCDAMDD